MKLIALKPLPSAQVGETFEVPENQGHVLKILGWAKEADPEQSRSRRTYRRRDLQAEATSDLTAEDTTRESVRSDHY